MCGITGFVLPRPNETHPACRLAHGGLLTHRGPDRFDTWESPDRRVGLQHYRLAIVDLSPAGAQPMHSADGRYTVAFNGEIYNHLDLRARLAAEGLAPSWRGHSDTETLLAAISAWGLRRALDACAGMFALALYDRADQSLSFARDRLGEKPLYYGYIAGALCFASEPKALNAVAPGTLQLHHGALAAYMRLGYIPGMQSVYDGILRLPPGTLLTVSPAAHSQAVLPEPEPYWDLRRVVNEHAGTASGLSPQEAIDGLDAVMRTAVKGQMVADVPLGALLSGGIDSSLVVGLMQAQARQPVRTFSIGFAGVATDEAPHARRVAAHLGTQHTELYVTAQDALDLVPRLPDVFCEPFADSSQVPTLLVSKLARQQVTVALTGDGGDELFAGYDRYQRVAHGQARIGKFPLPARRAAATLLRHMPLGLLNGAMRLAGNPGGLHNPADRLRKIADVLTSASPSALHRGLITLWEPRQAVPGVRENESVFSRDLPPAPTLIEQMMLADSLCYLPDDLLVKVDRAAMAYSLECRAPFLDHRVVEYAWGLSLAQKTPAAEGKGLLKQLLERYVPRPLFDRPKQGFGLPVDGWLQGPLREWAEALLATDALRKAGVLNVELIRRRWHEHLSGARNWQQHLWTVLMLQAWLERRP
jgi:asparagine synthase (glutamine-hydrolysing)